MKNNYPFPLIAALFLVAVMSFSCTKKAETTSAPQDSTAQPADTTEHSDHPEHPAEHPADSTK